MDSDENDWLNIYFRKSYFNPKIYQSSATKFNIHQILSY